MAAGTLCLFAGESSRDAAPAYSAASIVNAATFQPGPLAPNTIASIFGSDLAWETQAVDAKDIAGGNLPTELADVKISVDNRAAHLFYVSPKQINFLMPSNSIPGESQVRVFRQGIVGPIAKIQIADAAPALFQLPGGSAIAAHVDGSLMTAGAPGRPGEYAIIYATGLGRTNPDVVDGRLEALPLPVRRLNEFRVLLGGEPVETAAVAYAGVVPGFAGLYQINLKLPERFPQNPEIRIGYGEQLSAPGLSLPAAAVD